MEAHGFENKLDAIRATGELRNGEGETRGPQIVYAAILQVLQFAAQNPSPYAMAREILTTGLLCPQECKGAYINGLAGLFQEKNTDGDEWRKFRTQLQGLLLKAQALLQTGEMLLQDWHIDQPTIKQMELFMQGTAKPDMPDMATSEGHER